MSLSRFHTFGLSIFPTFLAVGVDPAQSGVIRIPHGEIIKSRTQAGTADADLFSLGAANRIIPGGTVSFDGTKTIRLPLLDRPVVGAAVETTEGALKMDLSAHKLQVYSGTGWETVTSV